MYSLTHLKSATQSYKTLRSKFLFQFTTESHQYGNTDFPNCAFDQVSQLLYLQKVAFNPGNRQQYELGQLLITIHVVPLTIIDSLGSNSWSKTILYGTDLVKSTCCQIGITLVKIEIHIQSLATASLMPEKKSSCRHFSLG